MTEKDISLRDHFAGQAMQGLNANGDNSDYNADASKPLLPNCEFIAEQSYKIADAMLKERLKQKP